VPDDNGTDYASLNPRQQIKDKWQKVNLITDNLMFNNYFAHNYIIIKHIILKLQEKNYFCGGKIENKQYRPVWQRRVRVQFHQQYQMLNRL
jgi:hypothetical protein